MIPSTKKMIYTLDWELLRKQKQFLLNEAQNNAVCHEIYDGLVNLIDTIQDAAVADHIATERKVFGNKPMPDLLDAITEREAILELIPKTKATPKFEPIGFCYNCEAIVASPKLFCDGECADEHAWVIERQKEVPIK